MILKRHLKLWLAVLMAYLTWSPQIVDSQGVEVLPKTYKPKLNSNYYVTTLLNAPFSPATYASMSSYVYQFYGQQAIIDIESKQACRNNAQLCNSNSECCSKFCRCTKWNTMGKEVCWRKCL